MSALVEQLEAWMKSKEDEVLEFKEAKRNFHFDMLVRYCVALANEGGGKLILGVTNKRPRRVVGSQAFRNLETVKMQLVDKLHLRIDALEINHPDGRVVIFSAPPRPIGTAIQHDGAYWMRAGESLVPMTPDRLKQIFDEGVPDFSATICEGATFDDLSHEAIKEFRALWRRKSGNEALDVLSDTQLLADASLVTDKGITYAALVLLGTRSSLGKYLAQAEVVFEYRSSKASIEHQVRRECRKGFFLFKDDLWNLINLRNEVQPVQEGLFIRDIPTFNEQVVREAVLNAISHRDYRSGGSVFVRQFPRSLEVVSPGGFLPGVNETNILWRQDPRNRRIAEALAYCGLVERSGQGADRMFRESIREGKPKPDFSGTDAYQVFVKVNGEVQNPQFIAFIERVSNENLVSIAVEDFLLLDLVYRGQAVPDELKTRLPEMVERGVLEKVGRGRGTRYVLSRRFYSYLGKKGAYTRKRGLDRETNKALLLKHVLDNDKEGSRLQDLMQGLTDVVSRSGSITSS